MRKTFLIFLFSTIILFSSCSKSLIEISDTKISLGTYVKITIVTDKGRSESAKKTVDKAFKKIEEYEKLFDFRNPNGNLYKFNSNNNLTRKENNELFSLISETLELSEFTQGYFDPTILPIIQLWGFDTKNPHLPENKEISRVLKNVGYKKISVYPDKIVKPLNVKLDLSGIAKGKIVDLIKDFLKDNGYNSFLIDAGGDIFASGLSSKRNMWRIAIQNPIDNNKYIGILEKRDIAIVTSGDYERFFIVNGVKYCHIFNSETGYPGNDISSVTILSESTAFADAIATAVFAMGSKKGYKFITKNNIAGYIVFKTNNKIDSISTPNFWN